ncbi:uncharacterized protein LOC130558031 isoform X3 [Triplophysa rosa]|uniref:uncharacterized protein LOC130558031 isoform X3 n=1 Tax=Triplophysa rosa TaxID=992332 RepID=UPI0025462222|nr:uncharacterized protein LOC130558031 isoform X3 [Triplophysa rosa]
MAVFRVEKVLRFIFAVKSEENPKQKPPSFSGIPPFCSVAGEEKPPGPSVDPEVFVTANMSEDEVFQDALSEVFVTANTSEDEVFQDALSEFFVTANVSEDEDDFVDAVSEVFVTANTSEDEVFQDALSEFFVTANVSEDEDDFVDAVSEVFVTENMSEDEHDFEDVLSEVFVTAHTSMESLYDKATRSSDDMFVTANASMESLFDEAEMSSDDMFVTANASMESLFDEAEMSSDDMFVTANARRKSVEHIDYFASLPKYEYIYSINGLRQKWAAKMAERSGSQPPTTDKERPGKKKRGAKAIKAFFKKNWKKLKHTLSESPKCEPNLRVELKGNEKMSKKYL